MTFLMHFQFFFGLGFFMIIYFSDIFDFIDVIKLALTVKPNRLYS